MRARQKRTFPQGGRAPADRDWRELGLDASAACMSSVLSGEQLHLLNQHQVRALVAIARCLSSCTLAPETNSAALSSSHYRASSVRCNNNRGITRPRCTHARARFQRLVEIDPPLFVHLAEGSQGLARPIAGWRGEQGCKPVVCRRRRRQRQRG